MMRRRTLLTGMGATLAASTRAWANRPALVTIRTPGCECCLGWVQHMEQAGFDVRVIEQPRLAPALRSAGVPSDLAGCHVGMVGEHSFSGHVPAAAVQRFLAAPGRWRGLAVPGMPANSPGMEVEGQAHETYEVRVFRADGHHELFARARGSELI